ncbi:hypothetical protein CCMA1212_002953 [Trichoderma ghanense]|uniref:Uncharacterized protein n=1 Tax=Trichoderma ghanense TaxID=65468 RepID=A0ABY2HAJ6_9HYPO
MIGPCPGGHQLAIRCHPRPHHRLVGSLRAAGADPGPRDASKGPPDPEQRQQSDQEKGEDDEDGEEKQSRPELEILAVIPPRRHCFPLPLRCRQFPLLVPFFHIPSATGTDSASFGCAFLFVDHCTARRGTWAPENSALSQQSGPQFPMGTVHTSSLGPADLLSSVRVGRSSVSSA